MDEEWMHCYCGEQVAVPHLECQANAEPRRNREGFEAVLAAREADQHEANEREQRAARVKGGRLHARNRPT